LDALYPKEGTQLSGEGGAGRRAKKTSPGEVAKATRISLMAVERSYLTASRERE
jgi:hypothetical protein